MNIYALFMNNYAFIYICAYGDVFAHSIYYAAMLALCVYKYMSYSNEYV